MWVCVCIAIPYQQNTVRHPPCDDGPYIYKTQPWETSKDKGTPNIEHNITTLSHAPRRSCTAPYRRSILRFSILHFNGILKAICNTLWDDIYYIVCEWWVCEFIMFTFMHVCMCARIWCVCAYTTIHCVHSIIPTQHPSLEFRVKWTNRLNGDNKKINKFRVDRDACVSVCVSSLRNASHQQPPSGTYSHMIPYTRLEFGHRTKKAEKLKQNQNPK